MKLIYRQFSNWLNWIKRINRRWRKEAKNGTVVGPSSIASSSSSIVWSPWWKPSTARAAIAKSIPKRYKSWMIDFWIFFWIFFEFFLNFFWIFLFLVFSGRWSDWGSCWPTATTSKAVLSWISSRCPSCSILRSSSTAS